MVRGSLTGSGWLAETGSGFRREPEFGKLAGSQEPAGFGATGPIGAPVRGLAPVHRE